MSMTLQKSIKDKSEELQDYLRDLKNWEKDIKKEDMKLSEKQADIFSSEELPAVRKRNSKITETTMQKKPEVLNRERKMNKISAYDYAAWDKFDVDKALESEDESETESKTSQNNDERKPLETDCKTSQNSNEKNTPNSQQTIISRPEQISNSTTENNDKRAEKLKEEGNLCYSNGKLKDAIGKYTQGIGLNPSSPILPANRAMAYIKLKKFKAAEKDCTRALQLDPKYIKAYLRRATARNAIANVAGAVEDYEQVLKLEPWNTDAKRELKKLKVVKNIANSTSESTTKVEESSTIKKMKVESVDNTKCEDIKENIREIRAVEKPVQLQSKKPLVRVPIIDVNSREEIESILASKETKENIPGPNDNIPAKNLPSKIDVETPSKIEVKTPSEEVSSTTKEAKLLPPPLPKPPKTSHQFSQDWRRVYKHKDVAENYLKIIPLAFYPKIEIEVDQLVEIVLTLCEANFETKVTSSIMAAVINSRGFFLNLSFLENDQKQAFHKIIAKIEECEDVKNEIQQLKNSL